MGRLELSVSGQLWGTCGNTDLSLAVEQTAVSGPAATTFYDGDQVGTTQLEISGFGAPVYKGELGLFGAELETQITSNRYKFTGKERDAESDWITSEQGTTQARWVDG